MMGEADEEAIYYFTSTTSNCTREKCEFKVMRKYPRCYYLFFTALLKAVNNSTAKSGR